MEVVFEVIGKDTRTGISSRTGEPYVIENLTLNFHGKAAKIRAPRDMKIYKSLYRLGTDSENGMTKFLSGAYKDNYYKLLMTRKQEKE